MIFLAIGLLVIAVIAFVVALVVDDREVKAGGWVVSMICSILFFIMAIVASITIVSAGSVGVPVLFGSVQDYTVDSGLHFINPFCRVEQMSVRTENYWMSHKHDEGQTKGDDSIAVRSANGLQMPVDVSVPYRLIPQAAPWVYKNLGNDYIVKLLRPALSTATRRAASHFSAEELYSSKRDEFADKIRTTMAEELTQLLIDGYKGKEPPEQVLVISQVLVGHVGIPDMVRTAIETKLKADQEQQAMDFQILREKKEAERKKVEAQGIQQFQTIVTTGISDKLLRWKAIEATLKLAESHNTKIIIIGSGKDGLPVLLSETAEPMIELKKKD